MNRVPHFAACGFAGLLSLALAMPTQGGGYPRPVNPSGSNGVLNPNQWQGRGYGLQPSYLSQNRSLQPAGMQRYYTAPQYPYVQPSANLRLRSNYWYGLAWDAMRNLATDPYLPR